MDNLFENSTFVLALETMEELIRMKTGIDHLMFPLTQKFSVTPMQATALYIIEKTPHATVSSIFRKLDLNQGNVSSMCKKLEADGFIVKNKCPRDERCYYISLTEKGQETLYGIEQLFNYDEESCWLTKQELDAALNGLKALKHAAEKVTEKLAILNESEKDNNNA